MADTFPDVPVVALSVEDTRWSEADLQVLAERAVAETFAHLGLGTEWEVGILACGDDRIAALNGDFRGKPRPTNVLSWPSAERGAAREGQRPDAPDPADPELGDIAIAYGVSAAEARAGGIPFDAHVTHLVVHAVLHLLGYDHERPRDGDLMEATETEILARMGLPDPYAPQAALTGKVR